MLENHTPSYSPNIFRTSHQITEKKFQGVAEQRAKNWPGANLPGGVILPPPQLPFAVARPRVWNSPPPAIRDLSLSLSVFRKLLKTYMFLRVAALVTYELAPWKYTD